jgi:hypothetical protein
MGANEDSDRERNRGARGGSPISHDKVLLQEKTQTWHTLPPLLSLTPRPTPLPYLPMQLSELWRGMTLNICSCQRCTCMHDARNEGEGA